MTMMINNIDAIQLWLAVAQEDMEMNGRRAELCFYDGSLGDADNVANRDAGFAQVWEHLKKEQDAHRVYLDRDMQGALHRDIYCAPNISLRSNKWQQNGITFQFIIKRTWIARYSEYSTINQQPLLLSI